MKKVKNILEGKPNRIFSVNSNTSVYDALKEMMEKNVSALLIVDNEQLSGIFTERDYARKVILLGRASKDTLVSEIMTKTLLTIEPEDSIDHCMHLMTDEHIRHLPVLDNGVLCGMISIGDLVKFVIEDQKQTIEQLEKYING